MISYNNIYYKELLSVFFNKNTFDFICDVF